MFVMLLVGSVSVANAAPVKEYKFVRTTDAEHVRAHGTTQELAVPSEAFWQAHGEYKTAHAAVETHRDGVVRHRDAKREAHRSKRKADKGTEHDQAKSVLIAARSDLRSARWNTRVVRVDRREAFTDAEAQIAQLEVHRIGVVFTDDEYRRPAFERQAARHERRAQRWDRISARTTLVVSRRVERDAAVADLAN